MTSWEEHVVPGFGGPGGGRQSPKQGSAALAQQPGQLWREEGPLPARVRRFVMSPPGNGSPAAATPALGGKLFSKLIPRLLRVVAAFQD